MRSSRPTTPSNRTALLLLCAFVSVAAIGCFERPVTESMEIRFLEDGAVEIGLGLRITDPEDAGNPNLRERLAEVRRAALRGEDPWTRSLRSLRPSWEQIVHDFREGELVEVRRRARVEDPEELPVVFSHAPVGVFLDRDEGLYTLEFIPTGANRASARQERKVRAHLGGFSASVADYLGETAGLYRYLETAPERAAPCLATLFGHEGGDLDDEETRLVRDVEEAMAAVLEILTVERSEAFTLDEMSRLVFDPFPADLEIAVAGTVEEVVGFEVIDAHRVAAPEIGLFGVLPGIVGRWLAPDLMAAYVEAARADDTSSFDLDGLAARPRHVADVPSSHEVRAALEAALAPSDLYRLRWRLPSAVGETTSDP